MKTDLKILALLFVLVVALQAAGVGIHRWANNWQPEDAAPSRRAGWGCEDVWLEFDDSKWRLYPTTSHSESGDTVRIQLILDKVGHRGERATSGRRGPGGHCRDGRCRR